jgi:hypothetical protein
MVNVFFIVFPSALAGGARVRSAAPTAAVLAKSARREYVSSEI